MDITINLQFKLGACNNLLLYLDYMANTLSLKKFGVVQIKNKMESRQFLIELGIIAYIFLMAGIMFFIYIKATPNVDIPKEYFFKVREPHIRKKRKLMEEVEKKAKKVNVDV